MCIKQNYISVAFSLAHVWMLVTYRKFLQIKSILLSGNSQVSHTCQRKTRLLLLSEVPHRLPFFASVSYLYRDCFFEGMLERGLFIP